MTDNLSGLSKVLETIKNGLAGVRSEIVELQREFKTMSLERGHMEPMSAGMDAVIQNVMKLTTEYSRLSDTYKNLRQTLSTKHGQNFARNLGNQLPQLPAGTIRGTEQAQVKTKDGWVDISVAIENAKRTNADYAQQARAASEQEVQDLKRIEEQVYENGHAYAREEQKKKERGRKAKEEQNILTKPPSSGEDDIFGEDIAESAFDLESLAEKYPQVAKAAKKYGFEMERLKSVHSEASSGIKRWSFQLTDNDGVMQNLSLTTNKYGDVLVDTQKRFRTFGAAISRNIQEVFKWAIAAQLIWLPMRKLQEVTGEMIELQTKLAAASIATGQAFSKSNQIFAAAYAVAQDTGSSVIGVVEGYELAYRAAGRYGEGTERAAYATALLRDGMLLASITTYDEAKALDVLVGGLIQTGKELDEGIELLDGWVAVSKAAAVSIETLAESFAITGVSAVNAGIDLNNLNGYVAVLAENLPNSATEIGNAMRAFVTGYQTEGARSELQSLGIAIENTKGEAVSFDFVMEQVYQRWEAGQLSPAQINKLGVAIGGGNRRATQFITILKNLRRAQELADTSASAHGDAEAALATQMQTVGKALIILENAFKNFAETLGQEGGFLKGIEAGTTVLTDLLNAITNITKALGTSAPVLAGFGIALSKSLFTGSLGSKLAAPGYGIADAFAGSSLFGLKDPNMQNQILRMQGYGATAINEVTPGRAFAGGYGGAIASTALQVGGSMVAGQYGRAGGQAVGGGLGAYVGGAIGTAIAPGPGTAIGALIGSQIGSSAIGAMSSGIWDYQSEWEAFFSGAMAEAAGEVVDDLNEEEIALLDMSPAQLKVFRAQLADAGRGFWKDLWSKTHTTGEVERREFILEVILSEEDRQKIEEVTALIEAGESDISGPKRDSAVALLDASSALVAQQEAELKDRLSAQVTSQEVSSKRFKELFGDIEGFGGVAAGIIDLVGDSLEEINPELDTTAKKFEYLMDFLYYASEDQVTQIAGMTTEMKVYLVTLEQGKEVTEEQTAAYEKNLDVLGKYVDIAETLNRAGRVEIPSMVDLSGIDASELKIVEEGANEILAKIYEGLPQKLKDQFDLVDWKNSLAPLLIELEGGIYTTIYGMTTQALTQAAEDAEMEGTITITQEGLGISDYSQYTPEQLQSAASQAAALAPMLQEEYGYEPDFKETVVLTSKGFAAMTIEQTLTNLILKDILDTQEKQLEGVYNLPANMAFYVPFSGYAQGQGGSNVNINGMEALMTLLGDWRNEGKVEEKVAEDFGYEPVSGYVPEKTLEDYFGPMLGPKEPVTFESVFGKVLGPPTPEGFVPPEPPYIPFQNLPDLNSLPQILENILKAIGGDEETREFYDTGIKEYLEGLLVTFTEKFGIIGGGEQIGVGEGAGAGDVAKGFLDSLLSGTLSEYFTSGQMQEDAMIGAPSTEEQFDKLLQFFQGLELFNLYPAGEEGGAIQKVLDFLTGLFTKEEAQLSGGQYGLQSPAETGSQGLGDVLQGLLAHMGSLEEFASYFTSGQMYDDAMRGAPSTGDAFTQVIEGLQWLENLSPYGAGEEGGFIEKFQQLFQNLISPSLNLEIQSSTQLHLDGQVVATVVKAYLAEDLLGQETASGTSSVSVVMS